jgi:glycosyltransferase involved in cell wall biosynthesis
MAEAMSQILSNYEMEWQMRQTNVEKSKRYDWSVISREYLKYRI